MKLPAPYFLAVIIGWQSLAPAFNVSDSLKVSKKQDDTLKIFNPFTEIERFYPYMSYDKDLNKWQITMPKYSLRSGSTIELKGINMNEISNRLAWFENKDELESFKLSLNILREIEFKNRKKYDLGGLGKYLGLSRNIMTFILALLSLLKN